MFYIVEGTTLKNTISLSKKPENKKSKKEQINQFKTSLFSDWDQEKNKKQQTLQQSRSQKSCLQETSCYASNKSKEPENSVVIEVVSKKQQINESFLKENSFHCLKIQDRVQKIRENLLITQLNSIGEKENNTDQTRQVQTSIFTCEVEDIPMKKTTNYNMLDLDISIYEKQHRTPIKGEAKIQKTEDEEKQSSFLILNTDGNNKEQQNQTKLESEICQSQSNDQKEIYSFLKIKQEINQLKEENVLDICSQVNLNAKVSPKKDLQEKQLEIIEQSKENVIPLKQFQEVKSFIADQLNSLASNNQQAKSKRGRYEQLTNKTVELSQQTQKLSLLNIDSDIQKINVNRENILLPQVNNNSSKKQIIEEEQLTLVKFPAIERRSEKVEVKKNKSFNDTEKKEIQKVNQKSRDSLEMPFSSQKKQIKNQIEEFQINSFEIQFQQNNQKQQEIQISPTQPVNNSEKETEKKEVQNTSEMQNLKTKEIMNEQKIFKLNSEISRVNTNENEQEKIDVKYSPQKPKINEVQNSSELTTININETQQQNQQVQQIQEMAKNQTKEVKSDKKEMNYRSEMPVNSITEKKELKSIISEAKVIKKNQTNSEKKNEEPEINSAKHINSDIIYQINSQITETFNKPSNSYNRSTSTKKKLNQSDEVELCSGKPEEEESEQQNTQQTVQQTPKKVSFKRQNKFIEDNQLFDENKNISSSKKVLKQVRAKSREDTFRPLSDKKNIPQESEFNQTLKFDNSQLEQSQMNQSSFMSQQSFVFLKIEEAKPDYLKNGYSSDQKQIEQFLMKDKNYLNTINEESNSYEQLNGQSVAQTQRNQIQSPVISNSRPKLQQVNGKAILQNSNIRKPQKLQILKRSDELILRKFFFKVDLKMKLQKIESMFELKQIWKKRAFKNKKLDSSYNVVNQTLPDQNQRSGFHNSQMNHSSVNRSQTCFSSENYSMVVPRKYVYSPVQHVGQMCFPIPPQKMITRRM